jgi:hypothetical protein
MLEVRGSASSTAVSLTVTFGARTESVANDRGEFRGEFENVGTNPGSVEVTSSDGSKADAAVEEK